MNKDNFSQGSTTPERLTILERDNCQREMRIDKGAAILSAIGAAACTAMFFAYLYKISGADLSNFANSIGNIDIQDIVAKCIEKVSTWASLKKLVGDLGPIGVALPIAALDFIKSMIKNAINYKKGEQRVADLNSIIEAPQLGGK